jgi:hypothetical protein
LGPSPFPTWASKQAFSRLRSAARALAVAAGGLLAVTGCEGEYSLAPTACDDYCRAVQRADCAEDYPAACVRDCENSPVSGACQAARATLTACYAAVDSHAFACVNDRSQPTSVCLPERRAVSECLAPGSGACLDQCARQAEACGASLSDCEAGCAEPAPGCEEASIVYNTCLLGVPVECRGLFEPDTRPIEDIPCGYEAIAAYICAK